MTLSLTLIGWGSTLITFENIYRDLLPFNQGPWYKGSYWWNDMELFICKMSQLEHKTTWLYYLYLVHYSKSNNNLITTILHVFKFKYLILLQNLKLKSEIHDSWIDYRSTVNAWCRVCTRAIFNLSLQDLTIGYIALKLSWKLEFWFHFICPDIISLVGNFKANSDISNIFIKLSAFCSTVFGKVIIGPFV